MSALDPTACLAVPGVLILGPQQAPMNAEAANAGGTVLGYKIRAALVEEEESFDVMSQAKGKRVAWGRGYVRVALTFVVVQYDKDVLNNLYAFSTASAGGFTGANTLLLPATGRTLEPGLGTPSAPVLFRPDDPSHPALLVYAPYWSRGGRRAIDHTLDKPREEAVVLVVGEDSSGNDLAIGRLMDLSLT